MKKALKILGVLAVLFIAALFAIPFIFQDKIKDIALTEANSMLNGEVYMGEVSLSFFKHFPNASLTINNFGISGKDEFKGDTLANAKKLGIVVDLKSIFSDEYIINRIELSNANIHGKILENGDANWNIIKTESDTTTTDTSKATPFKLALDNVTLDNINVKYEDYKNQMFANADSVNLNLAGNISQGTSTLADISNLDLKIKDISYSDSSITSSVNGMSFTFTGNVSDMLAKFESKLGIKSFSFSMNHIPYAADLNIAANVNLDADLKNNKYVLSDNSIQVNAIKTNISGFVQLVDSVKTNIDLKLNTSKIEFNELLSLIPSIYKNDFKSIKTSGKVQLAAQAKGTLEGDILPAFDAKLIVNDAMFKYPDLPQQAEDININVEANNPGGTADKTTINVSNFSVVMAGNPFSAHLTLKTPISDPDFDCGVKGTIDFNTLKQVVKLDGTSLSGILNADASAKGKLSYVEKKQYEKFSVLGQLSIKDMLLNSVSLPYKIQLSSANLKFSNKALNLTNCNLKINDDDLQMDGNLSNFIPYILSDGTIKGNLNINSTYFNLNDFLGNSDTDQDTTFSNETTTTTSESIDIPQNIDFALNLNMAKLIYTNIDLYKLKGSMTVKDKIARITSLSANTMDGSMTMNAEYNSQQEKPKADASINVHQMSIPKVFSTVNTANKFAPILENATGLFDMNISMKTELDNSLSPVLNTVNAKGTFKTKQVGIKDCEIINTLAEKVNYQNLKNPTLNNLNLNFTIKNGRIYTDQFSTKVSKSTVKLSGSTGIDQTIDYTAGINIPNSVSTSVNVPLTFNVLIGGTYKKPTFKIDASSMADGAKAVVKEAVTKTVNKALEEAKAQQEKILAEAQAKANAIKQEAQQQSNKILAEAQAQCDTMINQAKNPIEKKVKQKAADKIMKKAQDSANEINKKAEAKADSIIDDAKKKSDKLIQDAKNKVN